MSCLSDTTKAHLFGVLYGEWKEKKFGAVTRTLEILKKRDVIVHRVSASRWLKRWEAAGWKFDVADASRNQHLPRKLTPLGVSQLQNAAVGSNGRRLARKGRFSSKKGGKVKVSRTTVVRWAKRDGLVLSEPKDVRI